MQQEKVDKAYQHAMKALQKMQAVGPIYVKSLSAQALQETLISVNYAIGKEDDARKKKQLEGYREALRYQAQLREKAKSTLRAHKFAILAILATLVLISITYHFDFITLLKDPDLTVPWTWKAIGVIYALLVILAIHECWNVYRQTKPDVRQQPRKELVEEPKPEPAGKQGEGYRELKEEGENDVNPPE